MATINFTGLASGIDTRALIDAILEAERRPVNRLESQRNLFSSRKAALNELNSKLASFESTLQKLSSDRTFRARSATVSVEAALRATPGTGAEIGLFEVVVNNLAAAHKVKSDGLSASDEGLVTDGTITIQSGSNDPIEIDVSASSGNNSLEAVRDAINGADAGVRAAILYDGTSYRLTVRAENTGAANALVITDGTNLDLDDAGNLVTAGADASLSIDGIAVTSSTNQVVNAIPGVTLDLTGANGGDPITVEIAKDKEGITAAIQELVDGYNELVEFFNGQRLAGAPLQGDPSLRSVDSKIRRLFTGGVDGIAFGQIRALSSLGVDFDGKTGRATLDSSELSEVLDERFDQVGNLFASAASASDPLLTLLSSSGVDGGSFAVNITQAAEQATLVGSTVISSLKKAETLTITVGSDTIDVDLAKNDTIVEILDKLNTALTGAGIAATASDDGGKLRITTTAYGSAADLTVVSSQNDNGDGKRTGFDDTPANDLGLDVAGTIGGYAATGVGQVPTADEGTPTEGISLLVAATAAQVSSQGNDFGTVALTNGFTRTLLSASKLYTRLGDGLLKTAGDGLDRRIRRLNDDIERIEERLGRREIQLINQFSAAENAISALNSQQNTLGSFRVF